ncbi:hypothetical protein Dd703_3911 [Musicola paradisiaca Ech703]|uniref:Uncharacterized protein n=1 Tax=Musicola paradisiaca (strain Ech703) TaxID=579405 RepID=C6C655_MUSP7|nr:hypothetical protein Dd703_3911 [Musicola paradisiaca Ech703]
MMLFSRWLPLISIKEAPTSRDELFKMEVIRHLLDNG